MGKPCICRAILALLIIVLAWWQIGYNEILITFFALILLVMALLGNVCYCYGKSCEHKESGAQMGIMPSIVQVPVEAAKAAPAKKAVKRKPRKKKGKKR